jgi:hypothetical protein
MSFSRRPAKCSTCSNLLEGETAFCPSCGSVTGEGRSLGIECDNHPSQPAVAECMVCGKPVCGDCCVRQGGTAVCEKSEHSKLMRECRTLCSAESVFDAEMIRKNLEMGGIVGFTAIGHEFEKNLPLPVQHQVRVLVAAAEVNRARALLQSLGLLDA